MGFSPFPHQSRDCGILFNALRRWGAAINMGDTGTGKTITALLLCRELQARPIIVTRKSVISGWQEDCEHVGVEPLSLVNYEAAKSDKYEFGKMRVSRYKRDGTPMAYSYEWREGLGRVIFIFDESQNCATMESQNSKLMIAAAGRYKTLLLSATPFATPLQSGPQMTALRVTTQNDWYRWKMAHGCYQDMYRGWRFVGDDPDPEGVEKGTMAAKGQEIMSKIRGYIIPDRGCRTRREEIPGFPETLVTTVSVDTCDEGDLVKPYLQTIAEARTMDLERVVSSLPPELHTIAEVTHMVQELRTRQENEIRLLPLFEEMTEDALAKGESVAIFLNFDLSIEALARRMKVKNIIRGERKKSELNCDRGQAIWRFRENLDRVTIVNCAAGGAGVSLHDSKTKVPRTALISPPWSALVLKQVFGRLSRLGGGYSQQKLVFGKDPLSERMHRRVKARIGNLDALTDGDLLLLDL